MMTNKYLLSAATVGISALALASCGGSSSTSSASSSSGAKPASSGGAPMVSTAKTSVGTVVVNGSGRTLYLFEKDTGRKSTCNGTCAANWPPFVTSSTPKTAGGVRSSALSLVKRSDGRRQVTLDGHPLYFFKGDQSPGQLNGQGLDAFGAKWFTLSSAGKTITAAPSSSSGSGSSSGGGYGGY
jgi:predicted lipoprotein with Yx(FWY)xxD motif